MNRRDFLRPRHLAKSANDIRHAVNDLRRGVTDFEKAASSTPFLRFSRRAMATLFEILVPFGTTDALVAAQAALDEIDSIEDQLSVFRDHSEISRLNSLAASVPFVVEEKLFELLKTAQSITYETEGAFDVTAGPLIKCWGFFQRRQSVPSPEQRSGAMQRIGMDNVALDPIGRTIAFQKPGMEINLGSIGKGYALDRAAALIRSQFGIQDALLHGGHSSIFALGTQPGSVRGWDIGIRHPWNPEHRLARLWLKNRAIGTSAATFQHLEFAGRKLGHILDPRSGWPAEGMASVSVLAPTAAVADALATAFFILGIEKAHAYCSKNPAIAAILLPEKAGAGPVVIGLDDGEIELISTPGKALS